ncbi:family 43 glycosylhydrolase [Hymenobacter seoulensis]
MKHTVLIRFWPNQIHQALARLVLFTLVLCGSLAPVYALDGAIGSHDPSTITKDGNKYWMFTTGAGIYAAYSTDMFHWEPGPKTVFPIGTWPSWINQAVPGFDGTFWAPDLTYMNGKYYLYYSCSAFGSPRSAIGVATSPTLDQNSPNYKWTDLGMVVSSATQTDINAIDPALLKDDDGKVYMTYGSFSGGIGIVELDPATGLRKAAAPIVHVAGGNRASWEAPYLFKEGNYYYMVVNRGACCQGVNSTYFLVMGRSTNINGPYIDKAGVDLRSGGGTRILSSSGKYVGPGHFGLLRENGANFVSLHYYDRNDNGNPKLDIANMGISTTDGWPFVTRDWVAAGRYSITNQNSGLSWDAWGCTGAAGQAIAQGQYNNMTCQQWDFTPLGDGTYKITNAQGGLAADVINCNPGNGTKLHLWPYLNNNCQKFKIERTADGAYLLTSLTGNRVIEVPAASTTPGTQLALWDQNGFLCQRWYINRTSTATAKATVVAPASGQAGVNPENVTMQWSGSAPSYNLLLGTSPHDLRVQATSLTATSFTIPGTSALGQYYWRVDSNTNGVVALGDLWSYTVEDKVPPVALARDLTVLLDAQGHTTITAADLDNGSNDAYGIASVKASQTTFDCTNLGANTVVLTVTDNNGNTATAQATVTVKDEQGPTAIAQNISVTLVQGRATITAASINNGSSDNCGIHAMIVSPSTFTCDNLGDNTVTLTVRDASGNEAKATAVVHVEGALASAAITATPENTVYTGGVPTTLYLGYGPQRLTLTATGGTSYQWSPVAGLSSTTAASPVFTATTPGTFQLEVTATNEYGCTATARLTLTVLEARCGNKNDKVLLCHNGQELCVDASAVDSHLRSPDHHDNLGSCAAVAARSTAQSANLAANKTVLEPEFGAFPNPFTTSTTIRFQSATTAPAQVQVYNFLGQLVATLYDGSAERGREYSLTLDGAKLASGIYTCQLRLAGKVHIQRLVMVK